MRSPGISTCRASVSAGFALLTMTATWLVLGQGSPPQIILLVSRYHSKHRWEAPGCPVSAADCLSAIVPMGRNCWLWLRVRPVVRDWLPAFVDILSGALLDSTSLTEPRTRSIC